MSEASEFHAGQMCHGAPTHTHTHTLSIHEFFLCRMRVKKLPMILALHLKRFKYMEQLHRYTKLSYRVVFPLELRLFNTSGDAVNLDRMYDLVAVVVHCGRYGAPRRRAQSKEEETQTRHSSSPPGAPTPIYE